MESLFNHIQFENQQNTKALNEHLSTHAFLPTLESHYFLLKIMALESIFKVRGIKSITIDPVFSCHNEDDSGTRFLPHICIENKYSIDTVKNLSGEKKADMTSALEFLQITDDEIFEFISNEHYDAKNVRDLNFHLELQIRHFLNDGEIKKNNRFIIYEEIGRAYFEKDTRHSYQKFLNALKKGKTYQKSDFSFGIEFDHLAYSDESWFKTHNVNKAKNNFLFNYCMNSLVNEFLLYSLSDKEKPFINIRILPQSAELFYSSSFTDVKDYTEVKKLYPQIFKITSEDTEFYFNLSENPDVKHHILHAAKKLYSFFKKEHSALDNASNKKETPSSLGLQFYSQYEKKMLTSITESQKMTDKPKAKRI